VDMPPDCYEEPVIVYLVEEKHPESGEVGQIGGFFDQDEAKKLVARLASEGRESFLNLVPIHKRWVDYEFDR
jgi:hypothetical protein